MSGSSRKRPPVRRFSNTGNNSEYIANLIRWAEASSEPVLFPGLLAGWPAVALWSGPQGLSRLKLLAGEAEVQVMLSSSQVFFGDISRHQPAPMSFAQLLDLLAATAMPPLQPPPPSPSQGTGATAAVSAAAAAAAAPAVAAAALAVPAAAAAEGRVVSAGAGLGGGAGSKIGGAGEDEREPDAGGSSTTTISSGSSSGSHGSGSGRSSGGGGGDSSSSSDGSSGSRRRDGGGGTSSGGDSGGSGSSEQADGEQHTTGDRMHVYLAQQPLTGGLAALQGDAPLPACLYGKDITSANLWMCGGFVRSSLHYDPHHNLLALVSGRKVVTLVPPYMSYCVYPMPLTGDAPNHSQVPFADRHPAARHPAYLAAMQAATVVELQAGDALFVPEGWWHQVDSGPETTLAVNYWWRSALTEILSAPPPPAPPPEPTASPPVTAPTVTVPEAQKGAEAEMVAGAGPALKHPPAPAPQSTAAPAAHLGTQSKRSSPPPPPPSSGPQHPDAPPAVQPQPDAPPGPGLRNLFALRQLAGAAVEDIAEGLLAAVALPPPPPPTAAAAAAATAVTTGAGDLVTKQQQQQQQQQQLVDAIRSSGRTPAEAAAAPAATGSSAPAAAAATTAPKPRMLPPYIVGLLLQLRPGEAAALGLSDCPVACALAAMTPRQLAAALYDMYDTAPTALSELLTVSCRVPAVACLLTRAFDQLGSTAMYGVGKAGEDSGAAGDGGGAEVEAAAVPSDQGNGRPGKRQRQLVPGLSDGSSSDGGGGDGCGDGDSGDAGGADTCNAGGVDGNNVSELLHERTKKRLRSGKRKSVEQQGISELSGGGGDGGSGGGDGGGGDGGGGDGGSGGGGGGGGDGGGGDVAARGWGCSAGCNGGSDGGGGGGSSSRPANAGGGDVVDPAGAAAVTAVPPDFFERLYGTVDDPDEVFRLLLEGRAALNTAARRILMDSVLA